eukprot:3941279-Rhodomonas_salina.2
MKGHVRYCGYDATLMLAMYVTEIGYAGKTRSTELGYAGTTRGTELGYAGTTRGTELGYAGTTRGTELGYAGTTRGTELGYAGTRRSLELATRASGLVNCLCLARMLLLPGYATCGTELAYADYAFAMRYPSWRVVFKDNLRNDSVFLSHVELLCDGLAAYAPGRGHARSAAGVQLRRGAARQNARYRAVTPASSLLRPCYAISGTELAYGAARRLGSHPDLGAQWVERPLSSYARPTRFPVLTYAMLLPGAARWTPFRDFPIDIFAAKSIAYRRAAGAKCTASWAACT